MKRYEIVLGEIKGSATYEKLAALCFASQWHLSCARIPLYYDDTETTYLVTATWRLGRFNKMDVAGIKNFVTGVKETLFLLGVAERTPANNDQLGVVRDADKLH